MKFLRYVDWSEFSGLLVGAVLAIAICVSTYVLIAKLQQEGVLGKKEYVLYCDLVSAQGLRKGTTVQINGVNIGRVEDISLVENGLVRLKLILDLKYKNRITNKSTLYATRDQNIISERVINIDISARGDKILEEDEYIIAGTAQDIETVLKTANELIDRIGKLVEVADTLLNKVIDTNTTVGMLLGSRVIYDRLDNIALRLDNVLRDAAGTFYTLNDKMPTAIAFADTLSTGVIGLIDNLDNLAGKATTMLTSLDTTVQTVNSMVHELNSVMGTATNLITDGSQTINRTDDFVGGVSKFWFIRNKIPQKDSIPLLGEEW